MNKLKEPKPEETKEPEQVPEQPKVEIVTTENLMLHHLEVLVQQMNEMKDILAGISDLVASTWNIIGDKK